jgi:hypothetical protein
MSIHSDGGAYAPLPRRHSPDQVRTAVFTRTPLGRRGLNEDEVYGFTHRLADELAARDAAITSLVDENRRLKQAMRDWQSQQAGRPTVDVRERVTADTAALMAQAQQHIDAQVAQAELYCRQREQEAVQRYDEIVRQAHLQAKQAAEKVARDYRANAGAEYRSDQEQIQRQQVYLNALLQALDAVAAHLHATRQVFAIEVGKLQVSTEAGTGASPPSSPPDAAHGPAE